QGSGARFPRSRSRAQLSALARLRSPGFGRPSLSPARRVADSGKPGGLASVHRALASATGGDGTQIVQHQIAIEETGAVDVAHAVLTVEQKHFEQGTVEHAPDPVFQP